MGTINISRVSCENLDCANSNLAVPRLLRWLSNHLPIHSKRDFDQLLKTQSEQEVLIEKLVGDLSSIRITFGHIMHMYLKGLGARNFPEIAQTWILKMGGMSRHEWLAGTYALLHFLEVSSSAGAASAIAMLSSPELIYQENIGLNRGKKGKVKTPERYERARLLLLSRVQADSNMQRTAKP